MLNLYSELMKNVQEPILFITGLGAVYISGMILLIAVCFKFFEHFLFVRLIFMINLLYICYGTFDVSVVLQSFNRKEG